jgi:hypothetical protein
MPRFSPTLALLVALVTAGTGSADTFRQVTDRSEFLQLVTGKNLKYTGTTLQVRPDGTITGRAITWPITGTWEWRDGYFCRVMDWGGTEIPPNCQRVDVRGSTLRFTSDRGMGESANLRLR